MPDLSEHPSTSTVSPNGRYRIPNDNPFTGVANSAVRDEIYALGLRNPHRMAWDVDPADPNPATNNHLIVDDIGLHTWEEVNIVYSGGNYGYSAREGNQVLVSNENGVSVMGPLPVNDTIPLQITTSTTQGTVVPRYPVIQYGHGRPGQPSPTGDAISSGYVYRGSKIPQLYGKYLFGDVTTGQIFYADFNEMLAADDGDPNTTATIHSLDILWDNPFDAPNQGEQLYSTITPNGAVLGPMFQIVDAAYHGRGGLDPNLPGSANVTDPYGRADIRIQIGDDGELYVISKSDGMIRQIVGPARIPGDYNYDGVVDAADYDVWASAFGIVVPVAGLAADGNADGMVDAADYTIWRDALTTGAGSTFQSSVPEPSSLTIFLVILSLIGYRYRCSRSN